MKTFKLSALLVALTSVFSLSSCLDDNNNSSYATYSSYVTIVGDQVFGYSFYSDWGCILRPTTASVEQVLPGLSSSNVKRAVVSFDLADGSVLESFEKGKTYDIVLKSSYYGNYSLPTCTTINTYYSETAQDTLTTKNGYVYSVDNSIWAVNGYLNANIRLEYNNNIPFYMNTFFNSEKDIDVANNKLNLFLYYNCNTDQPSSSGQSVFSFALPQELYGSFSSDSIEIVLNAKTSGDPTVFREVGTCRLAQKDLLQPMY